MKKYMGIILVVGLIFQLSAVVGGASYTTVNFNYKDWGSYYTVSYAGEPYFAGYVGGGGITASDIFTFNATSNSGQSHRVLMNDNITRVLNIGESLPLGEGYQFQIKDIDISARTINVALLKYGVLVDSSVISVGGDYKFIKKVGNVSELPIIAVHIDSVYSSNVSSAVFIKGVFEISEVFISPIIVTPASGGSGGGGSGVTFVVPGVTPTPSVPSVTPNTGTIAISSIPYGASIYLDGVYKGTTPKILNYVPQGSHTIKLTLSGYEDWSHTSALISAGITSYYRVELEPAISSVVEVTPISTSIPTPTQTQAPINITSTQLPTTSPEIPQSFLGEDILLLILVASILLAIAGEAFFLLGLLKSDAKDSAKYRIERSPASYILSFGHTFFGGLFLVNFMEDAISGELTRLDRFPIPMLFSLMFLYLSFSSFALAYGALNLKPLNKTVQFHVVLLLLLFLVGFFYYLFNLLEGLLFISSIVLPSSALSAWQEWITNKSVKIREPLASADIIPTSIIEEPIPKEKIHKKDINITSAFGYKGPSIIYKVKIENNTSEPISDIKVHLFVPEVFLLKEKEKPLSMIEPKESKTITFEIRPTGECGDCNVSGKIEYYDYATRGRKILDIETKIVSVVCPVLKRKEIDIKQWEQVTDELIKAEENIKELSVPAENLFNITSRVIKDNGMFMLKPEITSTPQLFNGIAMFYAEGVKGLRYAAYIEVVGGSRKSRLILRVWAEKEEALTGFYHRILDEIDKRVDVKIFIDDSLVQYHVTTIKDSIIQRSRIGAGTARCPNCGRELQGDEKFCMGCGVKLD